MLVPKASVQKDDLGAASERNVWPAGELACVKSISISSGMNDLPQGQLGLRVFRSNPPHILTAVHLELRGNGLLIYARRRQVTRCSKCECHLVNGGGVLAACYKRTNLAFWDRRPDIIPSYGDRAGLHVYWG